MQNSKRVHILRELLERASYLLEKSKSNIVDKQLMKDIEVFEETMTNQFTPDVINPGDDK